MAHKRITVLPAADGHDIRENWMVHVNGKMKSPHTKKRAAIRKAREYASDGDTLEIRRTNGTIQKRVTVRSASGGSTSSGKSKTSSPGLGTFETGISDSFE